MRPGPAGVTEVHLPGRVAPLEIFLCRKDTNACGVRGTAGGGLPHVYSVLGRAATLADRHATVELATRNRRRSR